MSRWPRIHVAAALLLAIGLVALATSARERRPHPSLRAAYVQTGPLRLRYVRAGSGPAVLLLHGYGESLRAWQGVFQTLARRADVVALDLPGFGLSSKPPSGYSTDSIAAIILRAMDGLGVGRATLVGHSLGGAVAAAVAAAAPERVIALVLIDPALVGNPALVPDAGSGATLDAGRKAVAQYEAMRTRFTSPHDPHWLAESDSALRYLPASDSAYRTALTSTLREFDFAWLTRERADRLRMPVLIVWGEYDPVFPPASGRALAAALPTSRLEIIPRTWHRPHEERPEACALVIETFLDRLTSGVRTP